MEVDWDLEPLLAFAQNNLFLYQQTVFSERVVLVPTCNNGTYLVIEYFL